MKSIILMFLIVSMSSSFSFSQDIPGEAYDAAREYLKHIIESLESEGTESIFYGEFKDYNVDDIKKAKFKYPFLEYSLSYKDVLKSGDDASNLLSDAKVVHYCFNLIINDGWAGIVYVSRKNNKWDGVGYSRGREYIYRLMSEYGNSVGMCASVIFNSEYVFTIIKIEKWYYCYVDKSNKPAIHLFGGNWGLFNFPAGLVYLRKYSLEYQKMLEDK